MGIFCRLKQLCVAGNTSTGLRLCHVNMVGTRKRSMRTGSGAEYAAFREGDMMATRLQWL